MLVKICRGLVFSILVVVISMVLGSRNLPAADVPNGEGQLTPIPADSGAAGQPGTSPFREEMSTGSVVSADEGEDFFGLPLCGPPGRFWLRADYMMWWTNGTRLPPLVTTSPQGTPVNQAGVLPTRANPNNTTILYGNSTVNDGGRSGFRTTLGMWLDACHVWDLEFDYLSLGEQSNSFSQTSLAGDPILARPFFNVWTNRQASELVAYPNVAYGTVSVDAKDYFQSAGVTLSYNLSSCNSCSSACDPCGDPCTGACTAPLLNCSRTDLLVGFRYYNLSDRLGIHENVTLQDSTPTHNTLATFDIHDNFSARNDFYGSEIGMRTQMYRGRWSLEVLTKVAIGNNHQTVTIDGQTIITAPKQQPQIYNNGILAGPDNSNVWPRDTFTMIPQLGLELGCQVNCHWRAYVGYNILYWGSVARAADQVDLKLDPRNFPPPDPNNPVGLPFPAFPGRTSSFWAHGVNVGTEFRF